MKEYKKNHTTSKIWIKMKISKPQKCNVLINYLLVFNAELKISNGSFPSFCFHQRVTPSKCEFFLYAVGGQTTHLKIEIGEASYPIFLALNGFTLPPPPLCIHIHTTDF